MVDFISTLDVHMQVRFKLSPDDLVTFSKEAPKGTSFFNMQVAILVVIALVFIASDLLVFFVSVFLNDGSARVGDVGTSMLIKLVMWAVLLGSMWAILMLFAKREARKAAAQPGINGVFCEHLIEIDESGFTESTEVNRGFHSWRGVESVRETDSFVLVAIRVGATYIIPKRAFESDADRALFIASVSDHINQAGVPQPPQFG